MSNETISGKDSEYLRPDQQPVKIDRTPLRDESPAVSMDTPRMGGQHTLEPGQIVKDNGQRQHRRTPLSDALKPARDKI